MERRAEWNFSYALPLVPGQSAKEVELVVLSAVHMGWSESPEFFCAASETARDVREKRCAEPVGSLPPHLLEEMMLPPDQWGSIESEEPRQDFPHTVEVYVDNFCALAQSRHEGNLQHISCALLHSIHKVFPLPKVSGLGGEDSVLLNKLRVGEGVWETRKELLG